MTTTVLQRHLSAYIGALLMLAAASAHAGAAVTCRFNSVSEGMRPGAVSGRIVVDGKQWRADFDSAPGAVRVFTSAISGEDGQVVALNATNTTWYRLKTPEAALGAHSSLFSYGLKPALSALRVSVERPRDPAVAARVVYSYTTTDIEYGMAIRAFVTGHIDMWTRADRKLELMPWHPAAVYTGFTEVDAAIRKATAEVSGTVWKAKIDISRRLEGGSAYTESVTRTVSDVSDAMPSAADFKIPSGYEYQEPVIGAPGGSPPH